VVTRVCGRKGVCDVCERESEGERARERGRGREGEGKRARERERGSWWRGCVGESCGGSCGRERGNWWRLGVWARAVVAHVGGSGGIGGDRVRVSW